ncbi:UDP-2,3-diacylglucosamine diphosphatase [Alteromonas ponticola]|uniref:UDP-2,3-diacylglucosamine hydrolase n=1 Tax=Alteromonas aquimaris TaxID=2998417 RepID=A0ABT3P6A1_9ALTE|nr:UDP-2,3-diacylglucosamine diphosphatase [Alteromonas aquimaris]MCW8108298.1 UDP-2,3-diacylglucosamine diphosphatase [Alteromonas aquimaris]
MNFTYFISDLHLSEAYPDITRCLLRFLNTDAPKADALYVLGDLFDVWIGDDNITSFNETIAAAFKTLSKSTPIYFIHGNRDFAIRRGWTEKAGMTLLPEQFVIDLYGQQTLLTHGDELCTLDVEYQKFRRKSRSWWWPKLMLALPLWCRRKIAEDGRKKSQLKQQKLTNEIMDVTPEEVVKVMEKYAVQRLIHGHTHRPNIHTLKVNGKPATRVVLGDWYEQGSILKVSPTELLLEKRDFSTTSTD